VISVQEAMDAVECSNIENNSFSIFELLSAVFLKVIDSEILRHVDYFGEAWPIRFRSRYPRKVICTTLP
jgi:hypothetical protein